MKQYTALIPGVKFNETELRCDLPNGSRITLLGSENSDGLRGIYLDGCVIDEYAILSMAQTRAVGKAFRNQLAWLMKAAGFEATPAEEMDFVHEEPKKPSKPVQTVVAEILEEEPTREEIMMEVAKCTKVKQLTDIYFTYKQSFDSDETLMTCSTTRRVL